MLKNVLLFIAVLRLGRYEYSCVAVFYGNITGQANALSIVFLLGQYTMEDGHESEPYSS